MWAFYVNGYRVDKHCQPGLKGCRAPNFYTGHAISGVPIVFDRMDHYPYVYICGVGIGPKTELRHQNLHFPLEFKEGAEATITSYNGYMFQARNAVAKLPIPELPAGWNSIQNLEHTRCKNFRFAVSAFGYPPPLE
jgi:hypothetical protein